MDERSEKEICPILHHDEMMHHQMGDAEEYRIKRSSLSGGRLLCRLLGRLLSSASTTTSASHQENMMRLKQRDDFNI